MYVNLRFIHNRYTCSTTEKLSTHVSSLNPYISMIYLFMYLYNINKNINICIYMICMFYLGVFYGKRHVTGMKS